MQHRSGVRFHFALQPDADIATADSGPIYHAVATASDGTAWGFELRFAGGGLSQVTGLPSDAATPPAPDWVAASVEVLGRKLARAGWPRTLRRGRDSPAPDGDVR